MIKILDLGAANIKSVFKALDYLGFRTGIEADPKGIHTADGLVLPGVGSFGFVMDQIRKRGFFRPLEEWLAADRPLLGICLGLQLLTDGSEESPAVSGFGVFRGVCRRFSAGRIPHMGWNLLQIFRDDGLFSGLPDEPYVYFAHSYHPETSGEAEETVLAHTRYGRTFPCVFKKGKICGFQFHPEKSGRIGLHLLKNWVEQCLP